MFEVKLSWKQRIILAIVVLAVTINSVFTAITLMFIYKIAVETKGMFDLITKLIN